MNFKTAFSSIVIGLCAALAVPATAAVQSKSVITPKDSVLSGLRRTADNVDSLQICLRTYREKGDSAAVGYALTWIGKYYNLNSDYVKAIQYYQEATEIQKGLDQSDYINTLVAIATNCRRIGAYSSACDYLFEALKIMESSPEKDTKDGMRQKSYILNGIGNVYKYLNDGEEAEKYFRASLAIDEIIGNELGQSMNWNTLGTIYEYRRQYDSAFVMYNRGLDHNDKSSSKNGAGICYNRLGALCQLQGKEDEAENYFLKAYDILSKTSDNWNLAKTTCCLGRINIDKGNYSKAERLLEESENLVAGNRSYGHLHDIHANLAELYELQGLYKKANEELKLCVAYRDSSFNQRSGQEVAQTRLRYEQEKSQQTIKQVTLEKNHEKDVRNKILVIGVIVALFLLACLLFIFIYARLQHKRNTELAQMNALKNKFFSIISHDLKNPVYSQKQVLEVLVNNYDTLATDAARELCTELYKSSSSLLDLLTSLLNWSRLEAGKITNEPIRLRLKDVIKETVIPLQEQSKLKNVKIIDNTDSEAFALADRNIVSVVVRNLVSNAIKFSYNGGIVEILTEDTGEGKIRVCVKDNGTGISKEKLSELYKLDKQYSINGTAGEKGTGLGLLVSREMIELAGGKLSVESEEGKGSIFCFTVDKA